MLRRASTYGAVSAHLKQLTHNMEEDTPRVVAAVVESIVMRLPDPVYIHTPDCEIADYGALRWLRDDLECEDP